VIIEIILDDLCIRLNSLGMELPKKKRCLVCKKMFRPDSRVKDRQRVCSEEDCQHKRRSKTQASWRARNPDYHNGTLLKKRATHAQAAAQGAQDERGEPLRPPAPLKVPPALASIPWDFAQDELGSAGSDLLAILALLLLRTQKTR
jgi:hypothetical protein